MPWATSVAGTIHRVFEGWLRVSRLGPSDLVLILSVCDGHEERYPNGYVLTRPPRPPLQ
jgi:hypothetical protein